MVTANPFSEVAASGPGDTNVQGGAASRALCLPVNPENISAVTELFGAITATHTCRAVQMAGTVLDQVAVGEIAIASTGESIEHVFAAVRRELEHHAASGVATRLSAVFGRAVQLVAQQSEARLRIAAEGAAGAKIF